METELVKSRMRPIQNIPATRDFQTSSYLSEPVLAEAAARLLNCLPGHIQDNVANILAQALSGGLLARGERGEIVFRVLVTVAHDLAILAYYGDDPSGPRFHRPIPLATFLQNLVAPDIWEEIRFAAPFHAFPDYITLEDAISNAWVNFSHFVHLGDEASYNLLCASQMLKRGAAMDTCDHQYNIDGALPVLYGDPKRTLIDVARTSILQYQIKNTSKAVKVVHDATLVGSSTDNLPVISVTMHLGVEKEKGRRVEVTVETKDANIVLGSICVATVTASSPLLAVTTR